MSVNNNLLDKIFVHSFTKKKNVRVAILAYLLFNNKIKNLLKIKKSDGVNSTEQPIHF